jgi:general secretion pathway protein I
MANDNQKGLTLLEVLVALVILAVALTAIIKATTENIRATGYLQEKTLATWVGLNAMNKARLDLLQLPQVPEYRAVSEVFLGQDWEWQGFRSPSKNPRIQEVHVKVFHLPDHRFVTELTGYLYGS